jgi:hypothetical protein
MPEREGTITMSERTITAQDVGTEEELTLSQDAGSRLYVNDERVWSVSALGDGLVALTTGIRTVHISATDYGKLLHGEGGPSLRTAGILAARLAHLERHATALIEALLLEARITPVTHPVIWERVAALQAALAAGAAKTASHMRRRNAGAPCEGAVMRSVPYHELRVLIEDLVQAWPGILTHPALDAARAYLRTHCRACGTRLSVEQIKAGRALCTTCSTPGRVQA